MEESEKCPVCDEHELEIELQNTKGRKTHLGSISECTSLKKCLTCNFVFRFPRISNKQALGFYQDNVYWSSVDLNIYDSKRGLFRLDYLKKFLSNESSVLEIGAYNGAFLKAYEKYKPDTKLYALETDQNAKKFLLDSGFKDFDAAIKYDLICFFHVFEHYPEPLLFLKDEVLPLLSEDGMIYLEVPYKDYLRKDCFNTNFHHLSFYNHSSIQKIAETLNLKVIDIESFGRESSWLRYILQNRIFQLMMKPINLLEKIFFKRAFTFPYLWYLTLNEREKNKEGLVLKVVLGRAK